MFLESFLDRERRFSPAGVKCDLRRHSISRKLASLHTACGPTGAPSPSPWNPRRGDRVLREKQFDRASMKCHAGSRCPHVLFGEPLRRRVGVGGKKSLVLHGVLRLFSAPARSRKAGPAAHDRSRGGRGIFRPSGRGRPPMEERKPETPVAGPERRSRTSGTADRSVDLDTPGNWPFQAECDSLCR